VTDEERSARVGAVRLLSQARGLLVGTALKPAQSRLSPGRVGAAGVIKGLEILVRAQLDSGSTDADGVDVGQRIDEVLVRIGTDGEIAAEVSQTLRAAKAYWQRQVSKPDS